ncbi:hypothetical protein KBD71_00285 [Candidatus Woesebacteria bacterium]|nr:hypothetical protein [Candidatus Woesebacteria bacterium]
MSILFVGIYAVLSSIGLALLRREFSAVAGQSILTVLFHPWFWMGGFLYGIGFLMWLFLLSKNDLSFIFPIAAGSLVVSTMLLGSFFLKETIPPVRLVAAGFILIGIVLANLKK